jgi:tripartite-type tricarboxylate transporter receptor subunit TctC
MSKFFTAAAMLGLLCLAHSHAIAQHETYPSKPIRIIVPFTPGGSPDVVARVISQKLVQVWKQPVIVENRAGAGGNIGAEAAAKSPADGYTLLISGNGLACINPHLYPKASFDGVKDLTLVTPLGLLQIVVVVHPSVPAKTIPELIAYAKKQPDALSYASGGSGTPQHLSAEMFKTAAGVNMMHIPYKGNGPALADLIAGQVQVMFSPINSVLPLIKTGKVRALAVGGSRRIADLPELPTVAEGGVPGYDSQLWLALAVPTGTPKETAEKLNLEVRKIMSEAETKDKLAQQGIEVITAPNAEFMSMAKNDCARWAKVIKDAKVRAD